MAKKIGKVLLLSALVGSAVAGGMALYNKYKASSDDFDDDFLDFDDDDFDDDDINDDFNDYDEDEFDDSDDDAADSDIDNVDEPKEDSTSDSDSSESTASGYVSIPLDKDFEDEAE